MSNKLKSMYNSKAANIIKSILTGLGVIVVAIIIVVCCIFFGPVLLGAVLVAVQSLAWILVFCIVILLPLWCIGKVCGWGWGIRKKATPETSTEEDAVAYKKIVDDLKKEIRTINQQQ